MAIEQLDNTPRCQHIRLSGRRCKAPARRGTNWCLFHEKEHDTNVNLSFPPVEDAATVAVATDQILQALRDDTIDFRRAALMFSGLRIARANLKLLNLELGETIEQPKKSKIEDEDDDHSQLADFIMEEINREAEEMALQTGVAAPPPFDLERAKTAKVDEQMKMILEGLELEEEDGMRHPESGTRYPESGEEATQRNSGTRHPASGVRNRKPDAGNRMPSSHPYFATAAAALGRAGENRSCQ